jgi:predicted glutamine amidotransferase
MCELLGLSFNVIVKPSVSFRGFRYRGNTNRDGWGLAFYPDESVQVFKEPKTSTNSQLSEFLGNYSGLRSKIFISHVRMVSKGKISHKNTHPFNRELNGMDYVFAHNGTLDSYRELDTGQFKPIGETDSEFLFCYLLNCIAERRIIQWTEDDFNWFSSKLHEINSLGRVNCILSDGKLLFCYHDIAGYRGLTYVHRQQQYGNIRLVDEDYEINLMEEKNSVQTGYIVASKPLTNENWCSFGPGELIVFRDGNIVHSSSREIVNSKVTPFTTIELGILKFLRLSVNGQSLEKIVNNAGKSIQEIKQHIQLLIQKKYVTQDSRIKVRWDSLDAIYYTNSSKRKEIDSAIK